MTMTVNSSNRSQGGRILYSTLAPLLKRREVPQLVPSPDLLMMSRFSGWRVGGLTCWPRVSGQVWEILSWMNIFHGCFYLVSWVELGMRRYGWGRWLPIMFAFLLSPQAEIWSVMQGPKQICMGIVFLRCVAELNTIFIPPKQNLTLLELNINLPCLLSKKKIVRDPKAGAG